MFGNIPFVLFFGLMLTLYLVLTGMVPVNDLRPKTCYKRSPELYDMVTSSCSICKETSLLINLLNVNIPVIARSGAGKHLRRYGG